MCKRVGSGKVGENQGITPETWVYKSHNLSTHEWGGLTAPWTRMRPLAAAEL